jgi:hypothetical protein
MMPITLTAAARTAQEARDHLACCGYAAADASDFNGHLPMAFTLKDAHCS